MIRSQKPNLDELRIDRSAPERSASWMWLILALAVIVVVSGLVWWFTRPGPLEVKTVEVAELAGNPGERTVLNASGYVVARRKATVSSKVTGKVVEVLIEEGARVQKDQVLARLDDTNLQASLKLAQARLRAATNELAETRVRIVEAEQELQRQTGLLEAKISTRADYDRAEAGALALKARLEKQLADIVTAQLEVAVWQQQVDDTIIRAPFGGIVTSKDAQPGEMISPVSAGGGFTRTGICTIVDMDSLEIEIDVNESYIGRVEPEQPVEGILDSYPNWRIPCKVIAIIPTADRQKSTVRVRVGFESLDPRILPEMGVKVSFRQVEATAAGRPNGVAVPKAAVLQENGRDVVYVVRNGRAERRAVTLAEMSGDRALVSAGLTPGEKVAIELPKGIADGVRVNAVAR